MKFNLVYIFLFFCYSNSAQNKLNETISSSIKDTLYLDETDSVTDLNIYNTKLETPLFTGLRFENDSLVLFKLRMSHLFGTLDNHKKNQLFSLLSSRNKVDTTKIIIIHYQDTLKRSDQFPKQSGIVYNKDSTSHKHIINYKRFLKQHKQCLKKLRIRKKTDVYHFYNYNYGHPNTYKKMIWYKDNYQLIDKLFRDSHRRFGTIVLRPDGEFFCFNYRDHNSEIFDDIVKGKNWERHKKAFIAKLQKLNAIK